MITGKIESIQDSKSGKTVSVKVNGKYYSCSDFTIKNAPIGSEIAFETSESQYGDVTINWLNDWSVGEKPANAPSPSAPTTTTTSDYVDRWYMPFVSNTVAHAIQSQAITQPTEIEKWARAAKSAAFNLERKGSDADSDVGF